jgi:DNA-binding transcriptional MerR regulator
MAHASASDTVVADRHSDGAGAGDDAAKAVGALRTIGEVVRETGIAAHILRYWERQVPALQPVRRAGGRRYYRAEDLALVQRLHHLVSTQGYTLDGAARALHGPAAEPAIAPAIAAVPVAESAAPAIAWGYASGSGASGSGQDDLPAPPPFLAMAGADNGQRARLIALRNRLQRALDQA